ADDQSGCNRCEATAKLSIQESRQWIAEIEGKAAMVAATELGQRWSFKPRRTCSDYLRSRFPSLRNLNLIPRLKLARLPIRSSLPSRLCLLSRASFVIDSCVPVFLSDDSELLLPFLDRSR